MDKKYMGNPTKGSKTKANENKASKIKAIHPRTTNPSANSPEEQKAAPEFTHLKSLLEPFNTILNTLLCNTTLLRVISIHCTLPTPTSKYNIPVYTVNSAESDGYARGASAFTPDTPPSLQLAIRKHNRCDTSTAVLFPLVSALLEPHGARVDWINVAAAPKSLFESDIRAASIPRHTAMLITTAAGNEYVADFTIEQFGFEGDMWFVTKAEYVEKVIDWMGVLPWVVNPTYIDYVRVACAKWKFMMAMRDVWKEVEKRIDREMDEVEKMKWIEGVATSAALRHDL
jgi:hypothetical protein